MAHPRWLAAAFIVPALVLTAACGDDTTDDEATTAPAEETETTAEQPAADETTAEETAAAETDAAGGGQEVGCDAAQGTVIGYSEPIPDPNFQAIEQIIQAKLDEFGATLSPVNANLDPGKQISDIQSLVQQQVDVLVVNPVDPNAVIPALEEARAAGIPIVAQETTTGGPFFTNVTADVEFAAAEGARILKEQVGDGQVGAIAGPTFAEVIVRENEAFAASAAEAGLTVADTQTNQQITPDAARQIADAWKQQFGADLAGIWTFNDTSAVGAASAVDDTFAPVIVSINGQPDAIPLVEQGVIHATFDLQQDKLGQALAFAALAAICEQEVPEEIVIPVKEINADNVAEWVPLTERVDDPFAVEFEERDGRTYLVTE
jgi:ribose transport system substrate-binding protein